MPALDHVNLCVPESIGGVAGPAAEEEWLRTLGYSRVAPGPDAAGFGQLFWFAADDGTQVHLTIDPDHSPSARAHTAVRLDEALDTTIAALERSGHRCTTVAFDGNRHVFTTDPAGNLWELIGA